MEDIKWNFFFFFWREFQPMESVPDENSLSSDQDNNQFFRCRQGLNPRSLIQPSDILPVELTGTHDIKWN